MPLTMMTLNLSSLITMIMRTMITSGSEHRPATILFHIGLHIIQISQEAVRQGEKSEVWAARCGLIISLI
jgi:hypothetical protein